MRDIGKSFAELVEIMRRLRAPEGCPWDREQTTQSLLPYLIEETYEAVDAGEALDYQRLREELGDILLHIVFQAEIAEERAAFDIGDVIDVITQKMVDRHPHVFGDKRELTSEQVKQNWEVIKLKSRDSEANTKTVLGGVPKSMPALLKAFRVQEKAAQFGFDWERIEDVLAKVDEELGEFKAALADENRIQIREELGDLIFSLVNFARHIEAEPESCLNATIQKFTERFEKMERALQARGLGLKEATLEQMEAEWQRAKSY